ncbi:MAG: hypothetical protein N5P05_002709 [Chroococcopsis gigantea SAG 12.99]|jgi:hypothetical protein|nr:hypothetical protein [Chlorogloea purpurea SAG 13.99]MDV3001103.1 hypothetical protein [Chroococcopsis gigantea SAG 12.99]
MASRWGGLLLDFFRPPILRELVAQSLGITSFGLIFLAPSPIGLNIFLLPVAILITLRGNRTFWKRDLPGRWLQIALYYCIFLLLEKQMILPVSLPLLALAAYSLIPLRVSSILAGVNLSPLALSEARRWKAKNGLKLLAAGCFVVVIPHFLGVRDFVSEIIGAVLFLSAFTIYLEKIQSNLPLADFLSHFLLIAYYMVPAILALIFSYYV